jgi:hypothetical protein
MCTLRQQTSLLAMFRQDLFNLSGLKYAGIQEAFKYVLQVSVKDTAVPGEPLYQLTSSRSSQAFSPIHE